MNTSTSAAAAATFSASDFGAFLSNPQSELSLNLANASMLDVISHYEAFKRRVNPAYDCDALRFNITQLQDAFHCTIVPKQINDIFYSYFISYLRNRNLAYSTISTYCSYMRSILKWGIRHNCPVSATYDCFDIPKTKTDKVYLTPDQISHIYHFDVRSIEHSEVRKAHTSYNILERVKDHLVLSCSLGQRFSDMSRIQPEHFDVTRTRFTIVQQKTGNRANINIPEWAIDRNVVYNILTKYEYHAPYKDNISNYNKFVKFLLKSIGCEFLEDVVSEQKIDGEIKHISKPFYKMVSSHTARRTFVCYHLIQGRREIDIRKCTGHQDARSFSAYDVRE